MMAGNNFKASNIRSKIHLVKNLWQPGIGGGREPGKRKEAGHYSGLFTTTLKF
jgi:hypothetical protein